MIISKRKFNKRVSEKVESASKPLNEKINEQHNRILDLESQVAILNRDKKNVVERASILDANLVSLKKELEEAKKEIETINKSSKKVEKAVDAKLVEVDIDITKVESAPKATTVKKKTTVKK